MQPEERWFLATRVRFKLSASDNAQHLSIIETEMPYGFSPPVHTHYHENETFYVLAGQVRFEIDGEPILAREGDVIHAPAGTVHSFVVTSPAGGRFLTITDGGFEAMVREMSRLSTSEGLPDFVEPTRAEQEMLAAACLRHGIELLGPPLTTLPVAVAA